MCALAGRAKIAFGSLASQTERSKTTRRHDGTQSEIPKESAHANGPHERRGVQLFAGFCASQGLTTSDALRRLARSAALLGPTLTGEARAEVVALTRQMRAIGSNLNQAVHRMNAGHMVPEDEMTGYLDGVHGTIVELDRLYRSLCARAHKRAVQVVARAAG